MERVAIESDIDSADEEAVPSLGSDRVDDTVSQPAYHDNFDPSRDSDVEYEEVQVDKKYRIGDVEPNAGTISRKAPPEYRSRSPSDISRTAGETVIVVRAPRTGYPKTFVGQHSRAFQPKWAVRFKWVEYSLLEDKVYCNQCRHFGDGTLCTWEGDGSRFNQWKKASDKLLEHDGHSSHKAAVIRYVEWEKCLQTGGIRTLILDGTVKTAMTNRMYIAAVAEVVNFCARQGLPLPGHDESDKNDNRGNFLELLELVSHHDLVVKEKLQRGRTLYTSALIQNELIHIQARLIHSDICREVRDAGTFSIMADESRDLSKHEQVAINVRYWMDGRVREVFLTFATAHSLTAASLTQDIVSAIQDGGLSLSHYLSQSYDGASVMFGAIGGVQARVHELSSGRALYVHCAAHCLNLAVVGAIRGVGRRSDLFHQLGLLYGYLSSSIVHSKYEQLRGSTNRLQIQRLSDTRWVCQHAACHNVRMNLSIIVDTLTHFMDSTSGLDGERRAQVRGLMAFIDTVWVMELCIMEEVLAKLKQLHLTLQGVDLDLASATVMIQATIQNCSDEHHSLSQPGGGSEGWSAIWRKFSNLIEELDLPRPQARPVRRARKDSAAATAVVLDTEDDYKVKLYLPIMQSVESELKRRFEGDTQLVFTGIDCLHPLSPNFLHPDGLSPFADHYGIDQDTLRHDIATYNILVQGMQAKDNEFVHPRCLSELINLITPYKMALPALLEIATNAVTIPVGTAGCERAFSVMRRVKTWLRCQCSDSRLLDLAVLAVHRERAKQLAEDGWGRVVQMFEEYSTRKIDILI